MDDVELQPEPAPPVGKRRWGALSLQNSYAAKKTVAQGMMDVALITANANQMKFVLEYTAPSASYYLVLTLLVVSLLLQIAVGVSLIYKGRCDLKGESKLEMANRINNRVVMGVFLITIINVFIAAFSVSGPPSDQHSTSTL